MEKIKNQLPGSTYSDIGASETRSYEDRFFFDRVETVGGLSLIVAIVADGVGGGNLGQRAADLTVQTTVKNIVSSTNTEKDIPQMLGAAIGAANKSVYLEAQKEKNKEGMSSTIAIAVVHNNRLYIANVGDSRIYLVRDGKAKQITVDHTYAYERIKSGQLTPEKALHHPNADAITRSVGFEPSIIVDLGLYLNAGKEFGKQALDNQGLELTKDDVILVCSDGLIKNIKLDEGRHFVEEKEIVNILRQYHAEKAAKVMVDLAVGRNVDDNVTVALIEFSGRKIYRIGKQRAILWGSISTVLALILAIVWFQLEGTNQRLVELSQASFDATATSAVSTAIAASFTPTPTPTLRPTLVPGEIGTIFSNGLRTPFFVNSPISVSGFSAVSVNHTGEFEDGMIYLNGLSKILFEYPPTDKMNFVTFQGSNLFVYPGRYTGGAGVRIAGAKGTVDFSVSGSCMTVNYQQDKVIAACYEGNCNYQIDYGEKHLINIGTQIEFDINMMIGQNSSDIPSIDVYRWLSIVPVNSHAYQCITRWVPATDVPTQLEPNIKNGSKGGNNSASPISPTAQPTNPPLPTAQPTNPPLPTEAATPKSGKPTKTPVPTAEPTNPPAPTAQPTNPPAPTAEPTNPPAPTPQPTNPPASTP